MSRGYRAAYAPLLLRHMSQGHSLESFAALKTDEKGPVDFATVRRWLKRHTAFARAHEDGKAAAFHFLERLLLAGLSGERTATRGDTRALLVVLQSRFGDVYGDRARRPPNQETAQPPLGVDIREINDPQELQRLARSLRQVRGRKHWVA